MNLADKVILLTGASGGIGRVLAEILAGKGARLALLARREEELRKLAVQLGEEQCLVLPADVTDADAVQAAVNQCAAHFGRLDIIINNAGQAYFGSLENMPMQDFERIIKINVYGPLHVIKASLPYLRQSRGMVVNISSSLSKRTTPYLSAYASTKSMVDTLSDGLRVEVMGEGIHVLNYCPPETATNFAVNTIREPGMDLGENKRKLARVEDVAANIVLAMEQEKREVVEVRFLKVMNFFAPARMDRMFYHSMVEKQPGKTD